MCQLSVPWLEYLAQLTVWILSLCGSHGALETHLLAELFFLIGKLPMASRVDVTAVAQTGTFCLVSMKKKGWLVEKVS